jgi:hypothetical protein
MRRIFAQPRAESVVVAPGVLGTSVFASRPLSPKQKILTFTGPIITFHEAVRKGELESYALQIGAGTYLDTCAPGCFVNHSCDPNAGIVDGIHLVAIRSIRIGEEIRFDYSTTMDENYWTMKCLCGSSSCRGIIADFKHLAGQLQRRYLLQKIVQPFIAEQFQVQTMDAQDHYELPNGCTHWEPSVA